MNVEQLMAKLEWYRARYLSLREQAHSDIQALAWEYSGWDTDDEERFQAMWPESPETQRRDT
jgi:hypothetical protein